MFGGGYDRSPIPDETFSIDNPALSHVKFSVGVRWRINPRWRLALTYFLVVFLKRDITTSETKPPTNLRVSGATHTPAVEMTYTF